MKKYSLTLILVLCLFVITGGTYAAWTYYTGLAEAAEPSTGNTIGITATTGQSKGKITITKNELVISVTDAGSYVPELTGSGSLDIGLTKTDPLHSDELGSLQFKVTLVDSQTSTGLLSVSKADWQDVSGLSVSADDIIGCIELKDKAALNTYADFQAFETKLGYYSIKVEVKEIA